MREAGLADLLVARAHLVKNVERRDGRLVILEREDLEPVGQSLGLDVIGDTSVSRARERDRNRECERASECGRGFVTKMMEHGVLSIKSRAFDDVKEPLKLRGFAPSRRIWQRNQTHRQIARG